MGGFQAKHNRQGEVCYLGLSFHFPQWYKFPEIDPFLPGTERATPLRVEIFLIDVSFSYERELLAFQSFSWVCGFFF